MSKYGKHLEMMINTESDNYLHDRYIQLTLSFRDSSKIEGLFNVAVFGRSSRSRIVPFIALLTNSAVPIPETFLAA